MYPHRRWSPPPQACPDPRPHDPHPVPARGSRTGFTCAGRPSDVELERLLDEAFGPQ
jgi:hypothetical protein